MAHPRMFETPATGTEQNFVNVNAIIGVAITRTGDQFTVVLQGVNADPLGPFDTLVEAETMAALWNDRVDEAP